MLFKLKKLEEKLKVHFKDKDLLINALVHRSYLNEHPAFKYSHNERLEFLGDAVLELAVTDYLFKKFPQEPEGKLTNLRASLVNTQMLAQVARDFEIEKFLLLSKGEAADNNQKARDSILADAFEAVIGAIYLDKGLKETQKFLTKIFDKKIDYILRHELYLDPKSKFQEIAQEKYSITPHYQVLKEEGPDHDKTFTVGIYIGKELVAKGKGKSKQNAQMEAARKGLEKKGWK